jgi:hypothetical protein
MMWDNSRIFAVDPPLADQRVRESATVPFGRGQVEAGKLSLYYRDVALPGLYTGVALLFVSTLGQDEMFAISVPTEAGTAKEAWISTSEK